MRNKSTELLNFFPATCCLLSMLLFTNMTSAQDTIYWRANYKIKWEDFKGTPDNISKYGAVGSPGLSYTLSYNDYSFTTTVYCYFVKSKAWSKFKTSDTLLQHERLHFDIVELYARKLRKAFSIYTFKAQTINADLREIFLLAKKQKDSLNTLYDSETDFSRNRKQQLLWNRKIKSELDKLKRYSS